jgi:AbrB family looped-hinge helix DNA binding protein
MKTTIDAAGRLVIPREVRRQAGLEPGMALEIRYIDGRVEIEPAPMDVAFVREGRFVVAMPRDATEPLTVDEVERAQSTVRESRT